MIRTILAACLISTSALAADLPPPPFPPPAPTSCVLSALAFGYRVGHQAVALDALMGCPPPMALAGPMPVPPMLRARPRRNAPGNALDEIEPNQRGITRAEVSEALVEWCADNPERALCHKLERR